MRIFLIVLALVSFGTPASAGRFRDGNSFSGPRFGLGIGLGSGLSGISGYYEHRRDSFIQGLVSFGGGIGLQGDYAIVYERANIPNIEPYYGIGGFLVSTSTMWVARRYNTVVAGSTVLLGTRIPLGLKLVVPDTPLIVSIELAPGLLLVPGMTVFVEALLSVRFLF